MRELRPPKSAAELLDMYADDIRSHILEIAGAFDRIDRAGGSSGERLCRLREAACLAAAADVGERAVRILELLSV